MIADIKVNSLLAILREAGLIYLRNDFRSLRETPEITDIIPCPPSEYFHYVLQTGTKDVISKYKCEIPKQMIIDINIDGLLISKSPSLSLWPILGS